MKDKEEKQKNKKGAHCKEEIKEEKKTKKKRHIFRNIILLLLLVILIVGAYLGYRTIKMGGGLQGILAAAVGHDEETLKELPKLRCLLLGESLNLTDTIMVAEYDPLKQKVSILSIPRDTYTGKNKYSATSWNKINAKKQQGIDELIEAVNTITNLDIQYYVLVDTKALKEVVDILGGVWFDVPIDMNYDDSSQDLHIHLKAGYQLLDGEKAEQVVRFRHNNNGSTYSYEYGMEDLGRMRTQREFIKAAIQQALQVKNILKVGDLLDAAYKYIETNIDLSLIKDYIPYAVSFNMENLYTETLPGVSEKQNGLWIYTYDKEDTQELIDKMFLDIVEEETNVIDSNSINVVEEDL